MREQCSLPEQPLAGYGSRAEWLSAAMIHVRVLDAGGGCGSILPVRGHVVVAQGSATVA